MTVDCTCRRADWPKQSHGQCGTVPAVISQSAAAAALLRAACDSAGRGGLLAGRLGAGPGPRAAGGRAAAFGRPPPCRPAQQSSSSKQRRPAEGGRPRPAPAFYMYTACRPRPLYLYASIVYAVCLHWLNIYTCIFFFYEDASIKIDLHNHYMYYYVLHKHYTAGPPAGRAEQNRCLRGPDRLSEIVSDPISAKW